MLLRATRFSGSSGGLRIGWQRTAEREPTCVTGEAGHYSRTLASKAGNHSRHLLLVRKSRSADVDRWSGSCQDQAVSGDGDEVVGRRRTDSLALRVAVGSNLVVEDLCRQINATGDAMSPVMLGDGESQSASRRTVTDYSMMCKVQRAATECAQLFDTHTVRFTLFEGP